MLLYFQISFKISELKQNKIMKVHFPFILKPYKILKMKQLSFLVIFSCLYLLSAAKNYYIDKKNGNNLNNGYSESSAWQTLENVNQTVFYPGDSILFKNGEKWMGMMKPKGNGSKNNRIVIGAYGDGAPPVFDAEGKKQESGFMSATILLFNQEYWEIRDIEVQNFEKGNPEKPAKREDKS